MQPCGDSEKRSEELAQNILWKAETWVSFHVPLPTPPPQEPGLPLSLTLPLLAAIEQHMPWGLRPTGEGCITAPLHSPEAKAAGAYTGLAGGQDSVLNLHTALPPGLAVYPLGDPPTPTILFSPRQQLPGPWQL